MIRAGNTNVFPSPIYTSATVFIGVLLYSVLALASLLSRFSCVSLWACQPSSGQVSHLLRRPCSLRAGLPLSIATTCVVLLVMVIHICFAVRAAMRYSPSYALSIHFFFSA